MKRVSAIFYRKGYALADYYDKYGKGDDLSLLIGVMKDIPSFESEPIISLLIDGWVSWIKKEISQLNLQFDIIIRAPGHDELEYNPNKPMSILAVRLAKEIGAEYRTDIIKKVKITNSQTTLSYDFNSWRRKKNIEGSIISIVCKEFLVEKTILVLDDIKTTGSTLFTIAAALHCNGKSKLYFLTLGQSAKTQPPTNNELLTHLKNAMEQ